MRICCSVLFHTNKIRYSTTSWFQGNNLKKFDTSDVPVLVAVHIPVMPGFAKYFLQ